MVNNDTLPPWAVELVAYAAHELAQAAAATIRAKNYLEAIPGIDAPYLTIRAVDLFDWHHDLHQLATRHHTDQEDK